MPAGRLQSGHDILFTMQVKLFAKSGWSSLDLDNVQAVLFDLDGTLVDVDMNRFIPSYLQKLTGRMSGQASQSRAIRAFHKAVAEMFANTDAARTLEAILFEVLLSELAIAAEEYTESLACFCEQDLETLRPLVEGHPLSSKLIASCQARGWRVVLATNPIFPREVVDARIAWGGLDGGLFHHVTAYETAHYCKPNPAFFEELLELLQLPAEACLMIGNDPLHDLSAGQVGMQTCLLTPWKVNRPGTRFKADWQGSHEELLNLIALDGSVSA